MCKGQGSSCSIKMVKAGLLEKGQLRKPFQEMRRLAKRVKQISGEEYSRQRKSPEQRQVVQQPFKNSKKKKKPKELK